MATVADCELWHRQGASHLHEDFASSIAFRLETTSVQFIIYIDKILFLHQNSLQLTRSMAVAINSLQH